MTGEQLTDMLRHAYQCGRDNGSKKSEKNFNDFLQTEVVKQALSIADVVGRSKQRHCDHPEDKIWYNDSGEMVCNECGEEVK